MVRDRETKNEFLHIFTIKVFYCNCCYSIKFPLSKGMLC